MIVNETNVTSRFITIFKNPFGDKNCELHRRYNGPDQLEADKPHIIKFFIRTKLIYAAQREAQFSQRPNELAHLLSLIHKLTLCQTEQEIITTFLRYNGHIISYEYKQIAEFLELTPSPIATA